VPSAIARSPIASRVALLVLAAWFAISAIDVFPHQQGIDFYQFWGVPLARHAGGIEATPYVDQAPYARVLNGMADASGNAKFRDANRFRRSLEPMATPFLYAVFSMFGTDYEAAQRLYTAMLYAAAALAVFGLAKLRGFDATMSACTALLVLLTFNPFAQDVRSGNVNSLQLAALVALVAVTVRGWFSGNDWIDGLYLAVLALLVAFKPNTPWIALALGMHYLALRGLRAFAIGVVEAALAALAAFAIGAAAFGGAHAWGEWLALARGMDGSGMVLPFERGNLSLALVASRASPVFGPVGWGIALVALVVVAIVLALTDRGRRADLLAPAARRALADPWFAASVGIVLTFAASPLVWPHYHVLALIPIAWLLWPQRPCRVCVGGAAACYLILSRAVIDPLVALQAFNVLQALTLLSWLALVPGLLAHATRSREEAAATRGT
jgi:hypothetical protein